MENGNGSTPTHPATSGLVMKTWFGTDPSTTQPQVQHNNPRSAARAIAAQKKKQQQLETAQNTNNYRVIHPPTTRGEAQSQAMAPPPIPPHASPLPTQRMGQHEMQVPRVTGKRATDTRDKDAESSSASTSTSFRNVQSFLNASTSAGYIGSRLSSSYPQTVQSTATQAAQVKQQPTATDMRPAQRLRLDPPAPSGRLRPASWESSSSQCSTQSAIRLPELGPIEVFSEDEMDLDGSTNISIRGSGAGQSDGAKVTAGNGTKSMKEVNLNAENDFNVGWRRFGPVGRDITDYVPHYPSTPKIGWPTGLTTIAPFLPDERFADEVRNKLQRHQNYLENVTKKFRSSRERPDLCMHVPYTDERDAMKRIRACMKNGIPLAFDDFPDSVLFASKRSSPADGDPFMDPILWGHGYKKGNIGTSLPVPRTFRDSAMREAGNPRPVVTATLSDFKEWLNSPCIIRGISDIPCGLRQADDITDRISDNVVASRQDRFGKGYRGLRIIVPTMLSNDWFDVSTAGFLTFGHIDYSNVARSVQVRGSGIQYCIIFSSPALPVAPSNASREERKELHKQLLDGIAELTQAANNSNLETRAEARARRGKAAEATSKDGDAQSTIAVTNSDKIDGCILELRPGMKLYQPSGTVFATYTPVPTATAGKRFFTYGDLHRVELFRRVQCSKGGLKRNQHNCGVQLTLMAMAANLPSRTANAEVFYRKPMIALALMLTRPADYIAPIRPLHDLSGIQEERQADEDEERFKARRKAEERLRRENQERRDEVEMTERLRSKRWADNGTVLERLAYMVAVRILHACAGSYKDDEKIELPGPEYITEGARWDDPGPPQELGMYLREFLETHVDILWKERRKKGGVGSDPDDTDSETSDSSSECGR